MVYVVTSFDFGGSSDVKIHAVTDSYDMHKTLFIGCNAAIVLRMIVGGFVVIIGCIFLSSFIGKWASSTQRNLVTM